MKLRTFAALLLGLVLFVITKAALADLEPAASGPAASPPAVAKAPSTALASQATRSDLDDEFPPDVRERLSPEQLHQLLQERLRKSPTKNEPPAVAIIVPVAFFMMTLA